MPSRKARARDRNPSVAARGPARVPAVLSRRNAPGAHPDAVHQRVVPGRRCAVIRSIGSNWALNALQIGVLMLLTPFVLRTVGEEQNGTWITIVSMTGILRLLPRKKAS